MIYYLIPEEAVPLLENYQHSEWGALTAGTIRVMTYEALFALPEVPPETWLFSAMDRLTPAGRELAALAYDTLAAGGARVLNSPRRVLLRYDLLEKLYAAGRNRFRAERASEYHGGLRFPVFLREENNHNGNLSPMLRSNAEVREVLAAMRMRGWSMDELLLVEFCDTSVNGLFRKFSAFYIDGVVLPRNVQVSANWMVKHEDSIRTEEYILEERAFVDSNPHGDWLPEAFQSAGIDYGRMDYAMLDGVPQIWEINTNPTLGAGLAASSRKPPTPEQEIARALARPARLKFHRNFAARLKECDQTGSGPPIPLSLPADLLSRWRSEKAECEHRIKIMQRRSRFAANPLVRAVRPVLEPAVRRVLSTFHR